MLSPRLEEKEAPWSQENHFRPEAPHGTQPLPAPVDSSSTRGVRRTDSTASAVRPVSRRGTSTDTHQNRWFRRTKRVSERPWACRPTETWTLILFRWWRFQTSRRRLRTRGCPSIPQLASDLKFNQNALYSGSVIRMCMQTHVSSRLASINSNAWCG